MYKYGRVNSFQKVYFISENKWEILQKLLIQLSQQTLSDRYPFPLKHKWDITYICHSDVNLPGFGKVLDNEFASILQIILLLKHKIGGHIQATLLFCLVFGAL